MMDKQESLHEIMPSILERYGDTGLRDRWQEAASLDLGNEPIAYWIRESDEIVNIVWFDNYAVKDISLFMDSNTAMLNYMRLSHVTSVEVREQPGAAKTLGYNIKGDYVVDVRSYNESGGILWAADTQKNRAELREFLMMFLKVLREC